MLTIAIDPGTTESAYAILDDALKPVEMDIVPNPVLLRLIGERPADNMAVEWIESYGMAVGREMFETVFWIGRFWEAALDAGMMPWKVTRREVKLNLCHSARAKDANIRQALIDRFGPVGTKKEPGHFYGAKSHIWSAIAVGVTFADRVPFAEQDDDEPGVEA